MERFLAWMEKEVAAVVCGLLVVSLALVPRNASALAAVLVAVCAPAVIFLLRPAATYPASRRTRLVTAAAALPAVAAAVAALGAESTTVALWGARGQHTGLWLWLAVSAVFFALTERGRQGDLLRIARTVSVTGALLGLSGLLTVPALVDRFPALYSFGLSDSPSGLIENSISLAQALLVSLGAAAFLGVREGRDRTLGLIAALICAAALLVTNTKAALVALVVAVAVLGLLRLVQTRTKVTPVAVASLAVVVALGSLGAALWAGSLGAGTPSAARLDTALNGRVTIWHAVAAKLPERLLIGAGADHFTAWVKWDSVPGQSMEQVATDDPHSWGLYWLLSAGIPGLLAALTALWAISFGIATVLDKVGWRKDAVLLCVGLVSWGIMLSTAWTGPLAALLASMLAAAMLSAGDAHAADDDRSGGIPYLHAAIALAFAAAVVLAGTKPIASEYAWASALRARAVPSVEQHLALAGSVDDPAYVIDAARAVHAELMQTRNPQLASRALLEVVPALAEHSEWSVFSALQAITLTADAALLNAGGTEQQLIAAVERGKVADPTAGLWDYVGAVQLTGLGKDSAATDHARAALDYPLPEAVRDWTEELVVP